MLLIYSDQALSDDLCTSFTPLDMSNNFAKLFVLNLVAAEIPRQGTAAPPRHSLPLDRRDDSRVHDHFGGIVPEWPCQMMDIVKQAANELAEEHLKNPRNLASFSH